MFDSFLKCDIFHNIKTKQEKTPQVLHFKTPSLPQAKESLFICTFSKTKAQNKKAIFKDGFFIYSFMYGLNDSFNFLNEKYCGK